MLLLRTTTLIEIIFEIFLFIAITTATPYSWGSYHNHYDASLDPIVWSRSFVKDSVRKPRQFKTNALLHNSLDGGAEDEIKLINQPVHTNYQQHSSSSSFPGYNSFGKRRSSKLNNAEFDGNSWYSSPKAKSNNAHKRIGRRRHKLNARHRYGLV